MKKLLGNRLVLALSVLAMTVTAMTVSGCKDLDPAGVYKGDKVAYTAEMTTVTSYDVVNMFTSWELKNRSVLAGMPEIRQYADKLREEYPKWHASAVALRDAYAANPTAENKAALDKVLSVLKEALSQSTLYMSKAAGSTVKTE